LLPARCIAFLVDYPAHRSPPRLLSAVVVDQEVALAVALTMGGAIGW
jgi:hypothetical protein